MPPSSQSRVYVRQRTGECDPDEDAETSLSRPPPPLPPLPKLPPPPELGPTVGVMASERSLSPVGQPLPAHVKLLPV